jgi:hypothetical protein
MATQSVIHSVRQQESSPILEIPRNIWHTLAWKYGCVSCSRKRNGLLCARHFGELRRDIRKIVAYLAAAGY